MYHQNAGNTDDIYCLRFFLALAFSSSPSPFLAIQPFFLFFAPFRCVALFFKSCLQVCNAIFFNYNSLAIYFWPRVSPPRPSSCFRFSLRNCNWQFMCRTREREREGWKEREGEAACQVQPKKELLQFVSLLKVRHTFWLALKLSMKWNRIENETNGIELWHEEWCKTRKKNAVAGRETNGIEIELDGTEWKSVKVANKKLQVERTEWRV